MSAFEPVQLEIAAGQEWYPIRRTIQAWRCGNWAVHESQNGDGWSVTDVHSGRAIPTKVADGLSCQEAAAIARHLDERLGPAPALASSTAAVHTAWPYVFDALIAEALEACP